MSLKNTLRLGFLATLALLALGACGGEGPEPFDADRHALGVEDAPVTLLAFDDYQ
jgi:hypothetical protein